ncbi:MAG TPA: hypothetical protein PKY25_03635 [Bacilli bacterium]|nr:hypothetical protein [Bacilli bacterium]
MGKELTNEQLVEIIMKLPVGSYEKNKRTELLAKAAIVNHIAYVYLGQNDFERIIFEIIGYEKQDKHYTRYEACEILGVDPNYLDDSNAKGLVQAESIVNDYFITSGILEELYKRFLKTQGKIKTK